MSVDRAFVVYLDDHADPALGRLRGRAEHVVSGRSGHFESVEELLTLLARIARIAGDDMEQ